MRRYGYLADNKNGVTMAHAGEDPPDQPASSQIRILRRNGLASPTRATACRFPDAERGGGPALPGKAPIGTALAEAPLAEAARVEAALAGAHWPERHRPERHRPERHRPRRHRAEMAVPAGPLHGSPG